MEAARIAIEQARRDIANGETADAAVLAGRLVRTMERGTGTSVINATGVLLHTNLGRAVWSGSAVDRAVAAATSPTNIELDLETGERRRRGGHVTTLLRRLIGAEDGLVVNNNASAVLLALATTSRGKTVPVSRGELIEIGGSYRLPSVMEVSGAHLVEIGTTNRTRIGDYQTALQTHTCGAILKVHPSNYRIEGFTEEVSIPELKALATTHDVPLIYDIGSGLLDSGFGWLPDWLRTEPAARQSLAAGADLVTFSGDKLLGGPQAGIIAGNTELISQLGSNPLSRALRVDGVTYGALAATLEAYLDDGPPDVPFWDQALLEPEALAGRCHQLADRVGGKVEDGVSTVGAGSAPGIAIPSPLVRLIGAQGIFECLLQGDPPILCRRDAGDLLIDLRTVDSGLDGAIVAAVLRCR